MEEVRMAHRPWRRRPSAVFAALLVLSAALRLPGLGQSYWYDEIVSVTYFFRAPWEAIVTQMPLPNNHPLYSLLAKACRAALGEKEWVTRLPAFFMGVALPPALYLFGRRFAGEKEGMIAGLFAALSSSFIWFSQDARGYSGMALLTLISSHLFLGLAERFKPARAALYAMVSALAVYVHMYAGAVVAAHGLIALFLLRPRGKSGAGLVAAPAAGLLLALVLYLPVLGEFLAFVRDNGHLMTGPGMGARFLGRTFADWTTGASHPWLSLVFSIPAAAGFIVIIRQRPLVAAVFAASFVLATIPAFCGNLFVFSRFFAFSQPGLYLFAAAGITALPNRFWRPAKIVCVAVLASVMLPSLAAYYRFGKQAIRPARDFIRQEMPLYRTVAVGLLSEVYSYYDPYAIDVPIGQTLEIDQLRRSAVVTSYPWSVDTSNQAIIDGRCRLAHEWPSAAGPEFAVRVYRCD